MEWSCNLLPTLQANTSCLNGLYHSIQVAFKITFQPITFRWRRVSSVCYMGRPGYQNRISVFCQISCWSDTKLVDTCYDITLRHYRSLLWHHVISLQITSWVTVILLAVMGMITGMRVLLWMASSRRQGEVTLVQSLTSHDELQEANAFHDDDEPLPMWPAHTHHHAAHCYTIDIVHNVVLRENSLVLSV